MGEELSLFVIGSEVMVDVVAERRGFDDKVVEPLEIESGGVSVNVEEGGIDVRVTERVGRVEKVFGMVGGAGREMVSGVAVST
jgi:hypothetical protein